MSGQESRTLLFQEGYHWDGADQEAYKSGQEAGGAWRNIARQVLIGKHDEATGFHLRYFEIAPGGYSSLEKHGHAHAVIIVRGRGKVVLGGTARTVRPLDLVYIAPWTPHQFLAVDDEPLGFFCIVDADRDRPQSLTPQEQSLAVAAGASALR